MHRKFAAANENDQIPIQIIGKTKNAKTIPNRPAPYWAETATIVATTSSSAVNPTT